MQKVKSPLQHGQDMMNLIADAMEAADKVPVPFL